MNLRTAIDLTRFVPLDADECRQALGRDAGQRHVLFPAAATRPEKRFRLAELAVEALRRTSAAGVVLHRLEGVARADVPRWLNASDAILLTSAHEGSPNVVREAVACNVPVVSVDVGDVAERVAGVAGCQVAAADPDDLAAKLRLALDHGRTEGRGAVSELSLDRVAARLRGLYEEVLTSGASTMIRLSR